MIHLKYELKKEIRSTYDNAHDYERAVQVLDEIGISFSVEDDFLQLIIDEEFIHKKKCRNAGRRQKSFRGTDCKG